MASSLNTIFKKNLFAQWPISTMKLALYNEAVPAVDVREFYNVTGETSGTGYTAGGSGLTVTFGRSGTTGLLDIADISWTGSSFTTTYGLLYVTATIDAQANSAMAVLDWGGSKTVTSGTFTVDFPATGATTSTIRIA